MFLHNKEIEINASSQVREEGKVFCNKEIKINVFERRQSIQQELKFNSFSMGTIVVFLAIFCNLKLVLFSSVCAPVRCYPTFCLMLWGVLRDRRL